jgi:deoxyribodipyrimidine photo-lyase
MSTAVVVFTRDLRVRDHPALHAAARAGRVVPLFVLDDALARHGTAGPNRVGFLLDALADLDGSLRARGAALVVRRGPWVREVVRTARAQDATEIHLAGDVSAYARTRLAALERACRRERREVVTHPGHFAVEPGVVVPDGKDHFSVFTPFHRRWRDAPRRELAPLPRRLHLPGGVDAGALPSLTALGRGTRGADVATGGEDRARRRLRAWARHVGDYGDTRDALGAGATSRLSPYLHLGCVSARQVEEAVAHHGGAEPFLRQLCWRDFFAQVLAARPETAWSDFRSAPVRWRRDRAGLAAWREGRTGYPLVDAAMRQLEREGFVHNRARMVAASFLTKDLRVDWREGAAHFLEKLVDGDLASNNLSWQWVAGTGTGGNPGRVLNPATQARRFDPGGDYVRRYVAELAAVEPPDIFDPPLDVRAATRYPAPIVDHRAAAAEYRALLR